MGNMFANLRKLGRVGKQPLVLVVAAVFLVGAVAATLSWGTPVKQPLVFSSKPPARTVVLGTTSPASNQNQQGQASGQANNQNPVDNDQDSNSGVQSLPPQPNPMPITTPIINPPVVVEPPIIQPIRPPCNYCNPIAGHACPLYVISPCTPCGGYRQTETICALPETQ